MAALLVAKANAGPLPDSARLKTLALLARGDTQGALEMYQLATGASSVPRWLFAFQSAFSVANQAVGRCQEVARAIHAGFTQLGGQPQFVGLRSAAPFIQYQLPDGKWQTITQNGYHVVVRFADRAYDAYTGASGLPWANYLSRLAAVRPITESILQTP